MVGLLTTKEDMYVVDSGEPESIDRVIRQGDRRQLERICCVRRATDSDQSLLAWAEEIRAVSRWSPIELYSGLVVELAGEDGRLELPIDPQAVDFLLLSSQRLVLGDQTYSTEEAARLTTEGPFRALHLLQLSLLATARAMKRYRNVILADLFCNLADLDIELTSLSDEPIELLIDAAERSGSALLINERHQCPSLDIARRFHSAQVPIFLGSGHPWPAAQGRYRYGKELLTQLQVEG